LIGFRCLKRRNIDCKSPPERGIIKILMKIIAICGSPRKGNTEFVLKRVLTKLEERGHKTRLILLREKRIQFCDGCLSCDKTGKCKSRDDMQTIYSQLEESDLIILGSPNYFHNMSGMMKSFVDRLNPFYTNLKLKDKKLVAVVVGASNKTETIKRSVGCLEAVADWFKIFFVGDIYLTARESDEVENNPESLGEIDKFAENLAE